MESSGHSSHAGGAEKPILSGASAMARFLVEGVVIRHVGPVDLAIRAGECVCLSGPSGSGKSLLLRALADLDPHAGDARLDGRSAEGFAPADWRRRVGLLPAESHWWTDRVGDHFARWDGEAAALLGFGPETRLWSVTRLSTGERQRLALLRLLANDPAVLLLDEPTASLDAASVGRVEALVAEYRRSRDAAVLWVSHDPDQAGRVAGRRYRLEAGRVVAEAAGA